MRRNNANVNVVHKPTEPELNNVCESSLSGDKYINPRKRKVNPRKLSKTKITGTTRILKEGKLNIRGISRK